MPLGFAACLSKNVTPVDSLIVDEAIASRFSDFEDAMQYYSAIREGADAIITRNSSDFSAAEIEVYEPQQFLDMLAKEEAGSETCLIAIRKWFNLTSIDLKG